MHHYQRYYWILFIFVFIAIYPKLSYANSPLLECENEAPHGILLKADESAILERFFKVLFEESEAGYVLLGEKPLCIYGYSKENLLSDSYHHQEAVALHEGGKIWKKHVQTKDCQTICIHLMGTEEPNIQRIQHILIINIPLFHKTINEHLPLFQLVLGPSFTSEQLLTALIAEDQPIYSVLKNNNALIGILLGYGMENSISASRTEAIQLQRELPPFICPQEWKVADFQEFLPLKPSLGYHSLQEEFAAIDEKFEISSEKLLENNPTFIFGWIKTSEQNQRLLSNLEHTQSKIQNYIKSPRLAENTIALTAGKLLLQDRSSAVFSINPLEKNELIAEKLWEELQPIDHNERLKFCNALMENKKLTYQYNRAWGRYAKKSLIEARKNLLEADLLFTDLEKNSSISTAIPKRLYWRTIDSDDSNTQLTGPLAKVTYSIMSPIGHCLATQSDVLINLENTIPGFRMGVHKMSRGETREIWIHPSLAYGFDTSLEKCIHLKAIVTLLEIPPSNPIMENQIEPKILDLSFLNDPLTEHSAEENDLTLLLSCRRTLSALMTKDPSIDRFLIVEHLKKFDLQEKPRKMSQATEEKLNKVLWNIYFE